MLKLATILSLLALPAHALTVQSSDAPLGSPTATSDLNFRSFSEPIGTTGDFRYVVNFTSNFAIERDAFAQIYCYKCNDSFDGSVSINNGPGMAFTSMGVQNDGTIDRSERWAIGLGTIMPDDTVTISIDITDPTGAVYSSGAFANSAATTVGATVVALPIPATGALLAGAVGLLAWRRKRPA